MIKTFENIREIFQPIDASATKFDPVQSALLDAVRSVGKLNLDAASKCFEINIKAATSLTSSKTMSEFVENQQAAAKSLTEQVGEYVEELGQLAEATREQVGNAVADIFAAPAQEESSDAKAA